MAADTKVLIARMMTARRRFLRSAEKREFPFYVAGMTAADYIRRYNALNVRVYAGQTSLDFDMNTTASASSTYDRRTPLCVETINNEEI
jgi:hypothetical protein